MASRGDRSMPPLPQLLDELSRISGELCFHDALRGDAGTKRLVEAAHWRVIQARDALKLAIDGQARVTAEATPA